MEAGLDSSSLWLILFGMFVAVMIATAVASMKRRPTVAPRIEAYAAMIHHISDAAAVLSDRTIVAVNPALEGLIERKRDDLIGWDPYDLMTALGVQLPPREQLQGELTRLGSKALEIPINLHKGGGGYAELSVSLIEGGGPNDYIVFLRNVTDRVRNEQRLRQRDLQYQKAMQIVGLASWVYDVRSNTQEWSDEMLELFGRDSGEDVIAEIDGLPSFKHLHPEDQYALDIIAKHLRADEDPPPTTFRIVRPDGDIRHVEAHVGRLTDERGVLTHLVTMFKDITDELDREQQLRHAQKMEAVGQLTGGLAHDFNNLLHVILGNAELMSAPATQLDRSCLEAITRAALRGSELTQRLLAFSRKQMLQFKSIQVNDSIAQMLPLLERTLGASVLIETHLADDLLQCHTDVSQLENCLLNLALNAQHAMPNGGKLSIETSNVDLDEVFASKHSEVLPGRYVQVAVTDTGVGMSVPVLERVFEPFFTTKEAGKGSGLGLSMVFGFMKQCKGHVSIYSEEGVGTSVKLFLPATRVAISEDRKQQQVIDQQFEGKVLLVEDDEQVKELTSRFLKSMGFDVVLAHDAISAHREMQNHPGFSLLLTDVMLPGGVNGPAIGQTFSQRFPQSAIVYMSGYTEAAMTNRGVLSAGAILLNKPFKRSDLVEKIIQALGPAR